MDNTTKAAKELGRIPTRYLNQLDDTKTALEKYQETRKQLLDSFVEDDDEELLTEITIRKGKQYGKEEKTGYFQKDVQVQAQCIGI